MMRRNKNEQVKPGTVAMWWLGCTGMWFKTPAGCNITVDLLERCHTHEL